MDAEQVAVGWWPGDARYPHAAFYAYAFPPPEGLRDNDFSPGRWVPTIGEFVLDWDDLLSVPDPHEAALEFCRAFAGQACLLSGWDPVRRGSIRHVPPPVS